MMYERPPAYFYKPFEQTPCARGIFLCFALAGSPFGAARAVPLTQGDNVLFELFSASVTGRAARSAAGGLFNHSNDSLVITLPLIEGESRRSRQGVAHTPHGKSTFM